MALNGDCHPLLDRGEPAAAVAEDGGGEMVVVCEHAGRRIPQRLGDLGMDADALNSHLAWDIGAGEVARLLAARFNAALITQRYSRLVCDCNRAPAVAACIPEVSHGAEVPGNRNLAAMAREARLAEIFRPFHEAVGRAVARGADLFVNIHSYTPVLHGQARPWHAAVLFDESGRAPAEAARDALAAAGAMVGENEPYSMARDDLYTIPRHCESMPYLAIEIRQDLIADAAGQREWAERLQAAIRAARFARAA